MNHLPSFDGETLESRIQELPKGAAQLTAYSEAIRQADLADDRQWRLRFRYRYACAATFWDDPPKALPMAFEFASIFEEHESVALPQEVMAYMIVTEMAVAPIGSLPQIPISQWEELMDRYKSLVRRYGMGERSYWWQMCSFYLNVDRAKAITYFQKFWLAERDDLSDCLACEQSYAVRVALLMDEREQADEYARPFAEGTMKQCADSSQLIWLAYLENALERGDLEDAAVHAKMLYREGNRDRSDLSYVGAALRCFAFTDSQKAIELLEKRLAWTFGMWDRMMVLDFYKGAWSCCEMLKQQQQQPIPQPHHQQQLQEQQQHHQQQGETARLLLPADFPLFRRDGEYNLDELANWFRTQSVEIARLFDERNGTDYFAQDLESVAALLRQHRR